MKFAAQSPRRPTQDRGIVPMINVVFLLLIFFLMSATLAPPPPFEVQPPTASGSPAETSLGVLHISADGDLAYDDTRGEAVFEALAAQDGPLPIHVDARYPAADLARLLPRLAEVGVTELSLLTVRP